MRVEVFTWERSEVLCALYYLEGEGGGFKVMVVVEVEGEGGDTHLGEKCSALRRHSITWSGSPLILQ